MHILSNRGSMFDIATRISRLMSILLRYVDLITATDEKPASHKFDVANGIRIWKALQLTSENSNRAVIQKEVIESGLQMLFKVMSDERSMNYSASRDLNP